MRRRRSAKVPGERTLELARRRLNDSRTLAYWRRYGTLERNVAILNRVLAGEPMTSIAEDFGVSRQAIHCVVRGQ